jgi:hypothetical protein
VHQALLAQGGGSCGASQMPSDAPVVTNNDGNNQSDVHHQRQPSTTWLENFVASSTS